MQVQIVDRERELEQLRGHAAHPPALVVLRGRRRVGKSFLLRVALADQPRLVSYQAEERPAAPQLEAFAAECARIVPGNPPLAFASWADALAFLEAQARDGGPLVVVLDEFQRIAASDAGIESVIQNAWDRFDHEQVPITLILCGSALSFMDGLFQGGKPTHGRSTYRPLLLPLSYRDIAPFSPPALDEIALIERFSVLGGTPQYQRWAGQRPLPDVLRDVILTPDAPLYDDPEHLIREEEAIRERASYFGVLEAIARGASDPTAIGGRIGQTSQAVTQLLNRLAQLGYVVKVEPVEPRHTGRSRGYWKIADPYFRFWFARVLPNRSRLARGRTDEVADEILAGLPGFTSFVFEDCCREWIARHSQLGADADEIGSWWSRRSDVEVDVAAVHNDRYTLLGSCKWTTQPFANSDLIELETARDVIGPKAARAALVAFSKSGFTEHVEERAALGEVRLFRPVDLFGP